MFTAHLVVTLEVVAANAFSGIAALLHLQPILLGMVKAGVPETWLTFPIDTLKLAGTLDLLLVELGIPISDGSPLAIRVVCVTTNGYT